MKHIRFTIVLILPNIFNANCFLMAGKLSMDALPSALKHEECIIGMEFSGTDAKGRRVMGWLGDGKVIIISILFISILSIARDVRLQLSCFA